MAVKHLFKLDRRHSPSCANHPSWTDERAPALADTWGGHAISSVCPMRATRRVAICPKEAWHVVNAFLVRPKRCNGNKVNPLDSARISARKSSKPLECTRTGSSTTQADFTFLWISAHNGAICHGPVFGRRALDWCGWWWRVHSQWRSISGEMAWTNVQYSQRASKFQFSQTADNKFKRFTQKKEKNAKSKSFLLKSYFGNHHQVNKRGLCTLFVSDSIRHLSSS